MNKLEVVKKIDYKQGKIYIRKLDNYFEYLIIYDNALYSKYFIFNPVWWRRLIGKSYTQQELDRVLLLCKKAAETTIDSLEKQKRSTSKSKQNNA